jgi:serine/threonine protein kinase
VTRYELLDRIGVGGMAEIFRGKAVAAGGFEKPVAIKRILPHLSQDKRFVELLIAEAKVLSLLKHRNIVQIFDVGLGDDGQYFLVMEYVDGKDLGAVQRAIENRPAMPYDLALHIAAEICEALEHAHTARAPDGKTMSLVHRDVSPSNVLLSRAGEVKLTDFGIARRAEQETTNHGAVRGKFAYISPEQARNEHLDPRSDVFAVGILLWELVTHRRLFAGATDMDVLRQVRDPDVMRPRQVNPRLTPEVDELIMAALARGPRDRPTAGQLGAQLRSLRYSLDVTVGDPATELAKFIDAAEEVERRSAQRLAVRPPRPDYDAGEPTVIRIHTDESFSMRDLDGIGMARAREVIDRFDEEETRQALLSSEQMAFLRATARDSGELPSIDPPLPTPLPGVRSWRGTDEPTRLHAQLMTDDVPTIPPGEIEANPHFDAEEATRLVAPLGRRTPAPAYSERPLPAPPRGLTPAPGPHTPSSIRRLPALDRGRPGPFTPPLSPASSHPTPPGLPPPPPAPSSGAAPLTAPPAWNPPPPPAMFERPVIQRPSVPQLSGGTRARRRPLQPWLLVVGALVMALLAFAVTRACIHSATTKPPADTR